MPILNTPKKKHLVICLYPQVWQKINNVLKYWTSHRRFFQCPFSSAAVRGQPNSSGWDPNHDGLLKHQAPGMRTPGALPNISSKRFKQKKNMRRTNGMKQLCNIYISIYKCVQNIHKQQEQGKQRITESQIILVTLKGQHIVNHSNQLAWLVVLYYIYNPNGDCRLCKLT